MFRLYHAFPKRLGPFADVFRLHAAKGDALIQQGEDALTRRVGKVLVRDIAGLHDKYMDY
uniref:Uncharacterized protein n=1 Tax=Brassica oleracea TaxID=3712 RepID=A0A3P6DTN4_BRAOL|nr:unnamed protein product [Brassica oleracea]